MCRFKIPLYSTIRPLRYLSSVHILLICIAILLILQFNIAGCSLQERDTDDLEAFASAFRLANKGINIEPMLALYALDGSTDETKVMLKNALLYEHGLPVHSINFEPLIGTPDEQINYTYGGIKYGPTIVPIYRMRVRYRTEDNFESLYTIGKNPQGVWQIVCSKPVEALPSDL
ncbi:MAG: hypothetical protein VXZ83_03090 [Verrucomicrobiota bacterium]|nr:hypothetical protein [Verrucomicrobiota bacterium]